jgi:hypothetical protein
MVRTIITPQNNTLSLTLPDNLVGRKVEVILFAIEEPEQLVAETTMKPSQMRGFLSAATAEAMQQQVVQSRNEWDTF